MVEYQVLTEANGFGGWLENEDDLHTLEQAQAEMLRQEGVPGLPRDGRNPFAGAAVRRDSRVTILVVSSFFLWRPYCWRSRPPPVRG